MYWIYVKFYILDKVINESEVDTSDDVRRFNEITDDVTQSKIKTMDKSTYEGLHGISVENENNQTKVKSRKSSDEFDIFEDLC